MTAHTNTLNTLTEHERSFVDRAMDSIFRAASNHGKLALAADDRAVRVESAIARWVIESR